jgi:F-type H+-transporting ATPase subunit a
MDLTPDEKIFWQWEFVTINATLVFTWMVMAILFIFSWLITRKLSSDVNISRGQHLLESIVIFIREQIRDVMRRDPSPFLPFIGTLGLFISLSNLLSFVPFYEPPTSSLSTTAALATCAFLAVPVYGIYEAGVKGYLKHYITPSPFMLPFLVIGELSRTLALAIRLFGNVLSGSLIAAILLTVAPLFFPVLTQLLDLIIGQVQAYIFAILATVYIGSGLRAQEQQREKQE